GVPLPVRGPRQVSRGGDRGDVPREPRARGAGDALPERQGGPHPDPRRGPRRLSDEVGRRVGEHDPDRESRAERRPADYQSLGARQLRDFYARYQPFDQERTVAVERRILFPLDEARKLWMQGYLDRLSLQHRG